MTSVTERRRPESEICGMKTPLLLLLTLALPITASASEWTISLEPVGIPGMPGVQSFVSAQVDGRIVILGGRTDGLHQFRPPTSFLPQDNNTMIYVVDPQDRSVKSVSVSVLPEPLSEQLQCTNLEFHQYGGQLVMVGGYGYAPSAGDHITHPRITMVDVRGLVDDIDAGNDISGRFRTLEDERFAVTGGYLGRIGDTLMLVGGQRFDGRYNPMNGPSFTQTYTDAILRFTIDTTGGGIAISEISRNVDAEHLHRRDYNLLPQIFPEGSHGYTIFSGVFQHEVDLPFLHPVDVSTTGYVPHPDFSQYLNHYHSASFAAYDSTDLQQHTFFLGGMSQYYVNDQGTLIRDDQVPFVRTVARVARDRQGAFEEHRLRVQMPDLEGSSAEVVIDHQIPQTDHGVILLHQLPADTVPIGYMVGGIRSTAPNIFDVNNGTQSSASGVLYRISLIREEPTSVGTIPVTVDHRFELKRVRILDSSVQVDVHLLDPGDVYLRLYDTAGRLLEAFWGQNEPSGERTFTLPLRGHAGPVMVAVQAHGRVLTAKVQ